MTTPHPLDTARGSDTTLDMAPLDDEKQNHVSDTDLSSDYNQPDATVPNGDVEKGVTKPDAEASPAAPAPPNWMDPSTFPDGGLQAWLCVLGAFCALFVSFGTHLQRTCSIA